MNSRCSFVTLKQARKYSAVLAHQILNRPWQGTLNKGQSTWKQHSNFINSFHSNNRKLAYSWGWFVIMAVQFPKASYSKQGTRKVWAGRRTGAFWGAAGAQKGMLPPSSLDPDKPLMVHSWKGSPRILAMVSLDSCSLQSKHWLWSFAPSCQTVKESVLSNCIGQDKARMAFVSHDWKPGAVMKKGILWRLSDAQEAISLQQLWTTSCSVDCLHSVLHASCNILTNKNLLYA